MCRIVSFGAMAALTLLTAPALEAQGVDVSGGWIITYCMPGVQNCQVGSRRSVSMDATFEQDGTTVTGTAFISPRWPERVGEPEPVPLIDVSLDGDRITFTVSRSFMRDVPVTYMYTGTVTGDTMEGTVAYRDPVANPIGYPPFPFAGTRKGG